MLTKARATAMAYHKPPLIDTPVRPRPQGKQGDKDDLWSPYPSQQNGLPAHFLCHFNSLCDLSMVVNDWCQSVFGDSEKLHFDGIKTIVEDIYRRLLDWEKGMLPCIRVDTDGCILPQVLCLQYVSHNLGNETRTNYNASACIITPLPLWSSGLQKI